MKIVKSVLSLVVILAAVWVFLQLLKLVWFLAWALLPFIIVAGILYAIGYFAPAEMKTAVEKNIRAGLDWLDFKAPAWVWPFVSMARTGFDWLGLHVPK